jgi:FdhD protein
LSQRFVVLSGEERIIYDQDIGAVEDEDARHRRKGARDE